MIDALALVLEYLEADAAFVSASGGGIFAGRDTPPSGYDPSNGPCTVFNVRGGGPDYDDALLVPSVQFKSYGANELAANTCYKALCDALHNAHSTKVLWAGIEVIGQTLEEPETDWFFVLSFFSVMLKQS